MTLPALAVGQTFTALRHPHYRRFWWGGLVSLTGSWMRITALSWLVYDLTGSPLLLGAVTFVNTVPTMLLAFYGGALADRTEKRHVLVATQATFMAVAVALAVLTLTGRIDVWQIMALSAVSGIAAALDMPARQSLIPHLVVREDLTNAIALNSAMFNGSRIVGPAIAGLILGEFGGRAGAGWAFAVNAVTYLAVISALLAIPVDSRPSAAVQKPVLDDLREGMAYARSSPPLRTLLALLAVAGIFGLSFTVLMPVFARDVLDVPAQGLGMLMTASGVGSTIGALLMASARMDRPGVVIMGTFAGFVALLAAFALSPVYPLSLALLAATSGTMTAYMSATNTTIQSIVPDAMRGRIMSFYVFALFGTAPLGGLIMGWLASALGSQAAVFIGAVVCALAAAAAWSAGRAVSRPAPAVGSPS